MAKQFHNKNEPRYLGCHVSLAAKADELARSRTGDEKKATDLAALLEFWLIHGKPRKEAKQND
jgi:hypothetical protein